MNVIVTGGSGFIGSHLIRRLYSHGYEIYNVDIKDMVKPVDITNSNRLKEIFNAFKPDVVIHLAALASVPLCERNPKKAYKTNVVGTLNITKLALKCKAKIIFSSSAAVYGNPKLLPTPEESPLNPVNHYGITKVASENIIRSSAKNHVIFRIFNAYGPECNRSYVIPDIIRKMRSGMSPVSIMGTGEEARDFVYIDDVLDAFLTTIEKDVIGTFNLGTSRVVKIRELAKLIAKLMEKNHLDFTHEDRPRKGDFMINQADITKSKKMLGWVPKVSLRIGLKETISYYQQENSIIPSLQ